MLRPAVVVGIVLLVAGCSRAPERAAAASPTAPTAVVAATGDRTPMGVGGVSGAMDVLFPGRSESFDFRSQLETKYQTGLHREASSTFVDREGEVVWTQEYMRYRVNGCDQATAVQRVFSQIDGNAPGGICIENAGGAVEFPPRNEALDFRRQLETKYEQMNRAASQSFVDAEGGVIWTQEYLRYRTNSCDHATAVQKVFSQIDGNGVAATCYVAPACSYSFYPTFREVGVAAGTGWVDIHAVSPGCTWTATSDSSWLTFSSATTGTAAGTLNYSYTLNPGEHRTGIVRLNYPGGSATHHVEQSGAGFTLSVQLFDPSRSVNATTNCQIRSGGAANTCNLVATTNLPNAIERYTWTATYVYGTTTRTVTQTSTSNTLAITDTCGQTGSSAEGTAADLLVEVTARDVTGNSQSLSIGAGQLRMTFFTCGV
ncbi:MAG: BACON domain-containing carbohydrate-binding protein [Vicinamibacterales bacterium]